MEKISVAVVGASGYTGQELLRLLLMHPAVELSAVTSRRYAGRSLGSVFPRFAGMPGSGLDFVDADAAAVASSGARVAFLALPHGVASAFARDLLEAGLSVIDLSADFRLRETSVYEEFYGTPHPDPDLLKEAVYGLPEWRAAEIAKARLVACPGCYPTSILLPLLPLLKQGLIGLEGIVCYSMSGVSGGGRKEAIPLLFSECNESVRAYGLPKHRHLSELEQELGLAASEVVTIQFLPHLVPVTSGICTTTTARVAPGVSLDEIQNCLEQAYAKEPMVRLLGASCADTKHVTRTNFIDIGAIFDERTGRVILSSAEDNLVKGAGGQALQSFNLMNGLPQECGLLLV